MGEGVGSTRYGMMLFVDGKVLSVHGCVMQGGVALPLVAAGYANERNAT